MRQPLGNLGRREPCSFRKEKSPNISLQTNIANFSPQTRAASPRPAMASDTIPTSSELELAPWQLKILAMDPSVVALDDDLGAHRRSLELLAEGTSIFTATAADDIAGHVQAAWKMMQGMLLSPCASGILGFDGRLMYQGFQAILADLEGKEGLDKELLNTTATAIMGAFGGSGFLEPGFLEPPERVSIMDSVIRDLAGDTAAAARHLVDLGIEESIDEVLRVSYGLLALHYMYPFSETRLSPREAELCADAARR